MSQEGGPSPKVEIKQQVRQYTKSSPENQAERASVAQGLVDARRSRDMSNARIQAIQDEIRLLETKTITDQEELIHLEMELEVMSDKLAVRSAKLLLRLYDFVLPWTKKKLTLQSSLQEGQRNILQGQINADVQAVEAIKTDLVSAIGDRTQLRQAKDLLDDYLKKKTREWDKLEAEKTKLKQAGSIKNITINYGVLVAHGIPYLPPEQAETESGFRRTRNGIIDPLASWQAKIGVVIGLQPDLCASTFRQGDGTTNLFSKIGLFFADGQVATAFSSDVGSVARGLKEREVVRGVVNGNNIDNAQVISRLQQPDVLENDIQKAINERRPDTYNELVCVNHTVAGLYINLDRDNVRNTYDFPPVTEIHRFVTTTNIPLYVILGGIIHRGGFSGDGMVQVGEPLNANDVVGHAYQPDLVQSEYFLSLAKKALTTNEV